MKTSIQIWQDLYSRIEVDNTQRERKICSEEDLTEFENQTGIKLPKGYKEFCQVFGRGSFGEFAQIWLPSKVNSDEDLTYFKRAINGLKKILTYLDFSVVENLVSHAFVFGGTSREESFLWDLNSYSEIDQSYDIYLLRLGSQECYWITRDFTEFICGFCLGLTMFKLLPVELCPSLSEIQFIWK
jgi:hypothetical protein